MSLRIIWPNPDCSLEGGDGVSPITLFCKGTAKIVMGGRVVGDCKSLSQMSDRFIQSLPLYQRISQMSVGNVIVRGVGKSLIPHCFAIPPERGLNIGIRHQPCSYQHRNSY